MQPLVKLCRIFPFVWLTGASDSNIWTSTTANNRFYVQFHAIQIPNNVNKYWSSSVALLEVLERLVGS